MSYDGASQAGLNSASVQPQPQQTQGQTKLTKTSSLYNCYETVELPEEEELEIAAERQRKLALEEQKQREQQQKEETSKYLRDGNSLSELIPPISLIHSSPTYTHYIGSGGLSQLRKQSTIRIALAQELNETSKYLADNLLTKHNNSSIDVANTSLENPAKKIQVSGRIGVYDNTPTVSSSYDMDAKAMLDDLTTQEQKQQEQQEENQQQTQQQLPSTGVSKKINTSYRNWNDEFQYLYESPVRTPQDMKERSADMKKLVDDFTAFSSEVASKIVQEIGVPKEKRKIVSLTKKGVAGGAFLFFFFGFLVFDMQAFLFLLCFEWNKR